MNSYARHARHVAAVLVVLALAVAWFYATAWAHCLLKRSCNFPHSTAEVLIYWRYYAGQDRGFTLSQQLVGAAAFIAAITMLIGIYKQQSKLHGDARFASKQEVQKAGLFATSGIIIGRAFRKYLVSGGQDFVLLAAPTRSGKGVAVVIPNLLNWQESLICMDLKLENWNITSRYRAQGLRQQVFLFNPFAASRRSHRWNPLDEVSRDPYRMAGDVLQIAQIFYPSLANDKNRFFADQAQNIFLGVTLFLLETKHPRCTLGEVFRQGSGYGKPTKEHLLWIVNNHSLTGNARDALMRAISNPDETFGNCKASFDAPLLMFSNPLVDAATSASDFSLQDVRSKRVSIYFGITPNRLLMAERLVNLFFNMVIGLNTEVLPEDNPALKYKCLVLMDEFTAFGRLPILAKAVAFVAGYNLRLLIVVQSKTQLEGEGLYSRADARSLIVNHDVKIIYTPGDDQEAKDASDMLGTFTTTSTAHSSSRSAGHMLSINSSASDGTNISEQKRALMLPQELKMMSMEEAIIDKKGIRPIKCKKAIYYKDPIFIDRLKSVSPSLKALKRRIPKREQLDKARVAGELAAPVPLLVINLQTVEANAQAAQAAATNAASIKPVEGMDAAALQAVSAAALDAVQANAAVNPARPVKPSATPTATPAPSPAPAPAPAQSPAPGQANLLNAMQSEAAAQKLARDIVDWGAWSSGEEAKANILKAFFMQDFMGGQANV